MWQAEGLLSQHNLDPRLQSAVFFLVFNRFPFYWAFKYKCLYFFYRRSGEECNLNHKYTFPSQRIWDFIGSYY